MDVDGSGGGAVFHGKGGSVVNCESTEEARDSGRLPQCGGGMGDGVKSGGGPLATSWAGE